ncbi:MAG: cold shock domain-containing protein [Helicobacteraceae bacterium]|jgi:uncharacterized protein YbjQ (UPF0145 family)/cold shock CspA family protein|nr:cold shock domain-containing protein [Helicobacteraceae bacterium]
MKGVIKSYLPSKEYGYIMGDDGKNYFFRARSVRTDPQMIADGYPVHFEEKANPNGYEALNVFCEILANISAIMYEVPERFHIYRDWVKDGMEVLEESSWEVCGSTTISGESPEDAKDDMIARAKQLGANAIVHSRYNKGVGREGSYRFRTHHFVGVPVVVAKRTHSGQYTKEQLVPIIDIQAELYKQEARRKNKRSLLLRLLIYALLIPCTVLGLAALYKQLIITKFIVITCSLFLINLAIFAWLLPKTDHGWWLQKR